MVPVNQMLIAKQLHLSAFAYGARLWRPALASVVMAAALMLLKRQFTLGFETHLFVAALVLCVALGAIVYGVTLYALWCWSSRPNGAERACLDRAEQLLRKFGWQRKLA